MEKIMVCLDISTLWEFDQMRKIVVPNEGSRSEHIRNLMKRWIDDNRERGVVLSERAKRSHPGSDGRGGYSSPGAVERQWRLDVLRAAVEVCMRPVAAVRVAVVPAKRRPGRPPLPRESFAGSCGVQEVHYLLTQREVPMGLSRSASVRRIGMVLAGETAPAWHELHPRDAWGKQVKRWSPWSRDERLMWALPSSPWPVLPEGLAALLTPAGAPETPEAPAEPPASLSSPLHATQHQPAVQRKHDARIHRLLYGRSGGPIEAPALPVALASPPRPGDTTTIADVVRECHVLHRQVDIEAVVSGFIAASRALEDQREALTDGAREELERTGWESTKLFKGGGWRVVWMSPAAMRGE